MLIHRRWLCDGVIKVSQCNPECVHATPHIKLRDCGREQSCTLYPLTAVKCVCIGWKKYDKGKETNSK